MRCSLLQSVAYCLVAWCIVAGVGGLLAHSIHRTLVSTASTLDHAMQTGAPR